MSGVLRHPHFIVPERRDLAKVVNTDELLAINRVLKGGKLHLKLTERLDPEGKHVLDPVMLHNDGVEMRCLLLLKLEGEERPIERYPFDVPIKRWGKLKEYEEDDGEDSEAD